MRNVFLLLLLLSTVQLKAQHSFLDKEINLQAGQLTLKELLKNFSTQTGCVFSYDPTVVLDKKIIRIPTTTNVTLRTALLRVLPKNTELKTNGKFIVLKRVEQNKKQKTEKDSEKTTIQLVANQSIAPKVLHTISKQTVVLPTVAASSISGYTATNTTDSVPDIVRANSAALSPSRTDTVATATAVVSVLQDSIQPTDYNEFVSVPSSQAELINSSDSLIANNKSDINDFLLKKGFLKAAVLFNKKLSSISLRTGLYNVYSILSLAADYNKSYLVGIGAGVNIKLNSQLSMDMDVVSNSLYAGKSYLLKVRASNTQFSPTLNYSVGKSVQFSGGPILQFIKSRYVGTVPSTNLGSLVAIGLSLGVKIDLINSFYPNRRY